MLAAVFARLRHCYPQQKTNDTREEMPCTGGSRLSRCLRCWPPAAAGRAAQNYPSRPIRAIASQGPGGLSDLFMRALAQRIGPALGTDRGRGPRRRGRHDRRPGLRGRRAGRLHDLHSSRRGDRSSIRSSSRCGLRSGEEPGADHQALLSDAGVRGERLAGRQIVRRAGGAGQGQAQHAQLHGAFDVEGRLHGASSTRRTAPTSSACRSRAAATPSTACSPAPRRSRFSASAT